MPEQVSKRGVPVSGSVSDAQPFETASIRFGRKGLDLKSAADQVPPDAYRILTNALHNADGQIVARPGLVPLDTSKVNVHSIRRLNDPENGTFTRLWGVGTDLYAGQTIASLIDSGYTGNPVTFVPYRPLLSNQSWMFVADTNRARAIAPDGTLVQIGLPAPTAAAGVAVQPQEQTPICQFNSTDATDAAAWTNNAGFDFSTPPNPTALPVTTDAFGKVGSSVQFKANPSTSNPVFAAAKGYYSFWGLPKTVNLSVVGSQPATDDDLIHLWTMFSHPDLTAEMRLYFVLDEVFDPSILPGTSLEGKNQNFYVKTWRQNDFAAFLQSQTSQINAAEVARVRAVRDQDLKNRAIDDTRNSWDVQRAARDPARTISLQTGAGRLQWVEYGVVGTPVRRGDFQRVGADTDRTWATVTGIVVYLQTVEGTGGETAVWLNNCYLGGGYGPDTAEPGDQQYDYRYTNFDPRTGFEGNPSPTMDPTLFVDSLRQQIIVTPSSFGDSAVRQRFYRRGASLFSDWFFLGENDSDGGAFTDSLTDAAIQAAGSLELDNDAFVTSIDDAGDPIYENEVPVIFGPCQDLLFALGDVHRPGDVYYCKPGQPGSWPAANHVEVCAPSEPLMNGGVYGTQAFVLSTERGYLLYPNLTTSATSVTAVPTECRKGLKGRWALAIGHGYVWFGSEDGIYKTSGGAAEPVADDLRPLFFGETVEGYSPIDLSDAALPFYRLSIHNFDLHWIYKGTDGNLHELVYSILYDYWRAVERQTHDPRVAYSDEGSTDLLYGTLSGGAYTEGGTADDTDPIAVTVRTGTTDFGRPREDKRLGDLYLDVDPQGVDITVGTRLNSDSVVNTSGVIAGVVGRDRYIVDPFGDVPQQARTANLQISWSSAVAAPVLYQAGVSLVPQPDVTLTRVTQWEDLSSPDEVYLTGVTLDVDTGDGAKSFYVEYDDADTENTWRTLGPYTLTHDQRHKAKFSWPVVKAKLVRIRPVGDCQPWQLFRVDWIFDPEPPRIALWDINWENAWDQYVTGVDLECNTFGATKTVQVYIDQVLYHTLPVVAAGRKVVHLTVQPPRRGHVLRFVAIDANPGLLYSHRWHSDPEPSEQTNWNQNYSSWGYDSDKWLKALVFHCDTFAVNKQVTVEIDGAVVETLIVNANGRSVVELALSEQHLGRVFRFLPVDANPGRVYNITPVFDLEPLALTRWETQEVTAGIDGDKLALYAHIALKAPAPVTLTVYAFNEAGRMLTRAYDLDRTLVSGDIVKVKRFVPFERSKGVLYKFVLTSAQAFWLYREESTVCFVPWGSDQRADVKVFGNDDLDPSRGMGNAALQAATPGGQAS